MKGLIIKDFINLKKNAKIFGALTILYGFMAFTMKDTNFFSTIFTMLFAILIISLYSYDELAKWDGFALTMPISKDNVVQAKYIMMLLLSLIGVVYSIIFSAIISFTSKSDSFLSSIQSSGVGAAIVILFYSITIPFITKLGVEKARLIFFAAYFIPFIVTMIVSKLTKNGGSIMPETLTKIIDIFIRYVYIILPVLVVVALGISYSISIAIYRKKEF